MNKFYSSVSFVLLLLVCLFGDNVLAQSFKKGSLMISLSEGTTYSTFSTNTTTPGGNEHNVGNITGQRDPITVEYGLTNHWGLGINMGGDIYNADPSKYYNFQTPTNSIKAVTSELTLDANYHFFVTRHFDLAGFVSVGPASVSFKGTADDRAYQYNACGLIFRTGTKARYYITKRLGVMAMVSTFITQCSAQGEKGNTVGNNSTTTIKGSAIEFGPCYRILR